LYAEGVDVAKPPEGVLSSVCSEAGALEVVLGRSAQPQNFWDFLVPEKDLQSRVSRQHFKILCRQQLSGGQSHPALFLQCLSPNGLVLNGRFLGRDAGEQRIQDRDAIALATCRVVESASEPAVSDASAATAALWTVPALKPFLIFELQVPDLPREKHFTAKSQVLQASSASSFHGFSSRLPESANECFATQRGSVLCESPILKFFRSSMGS